MKTFVICSGGLDSVVLANRTQAEQHLAGLLSFDYGQRHRKELIFAAACGSRLRVPHEIIDMRQIGQCLSGSALTDKVAVPDGHYAEETYPCGEDRCGTDLTAVAFVVRHGLWISTRTGSTRPFWLC